MPKSTKPDKRAEALIDECVRTATLVGRLRGGAATYKARLSGMTVPQLEKERGQLELERRRRYSATADNLLASTGPRAVSVYLKTAGLLVFMQRIDLLDLVMAGGVIPEPLTSRVLEMVEAEGVTAEMLSPEKAAETVQSMRAIACASCLQPPPEYFNDPDYDPDGIDPHRCARLFVMPGGPCGPGQLPVYVGEMEQRADGWRGLSRADLRTLVKAAIDNGPGALLGFRLRQESLVAAAHGGEDDGDETERDPGGDVPVGGTGPRPSRRRVRVVG